jgi:hypothetical protein
MNLLHLWTRCPCEGYVPPGKGYVPPDVLSETADQDRGARSIG